MSEDNARDERLEKIRREIASPAGRGWVKAMPDPSPYGCPQCGRRLEFRRGKRTDFLMCPGYNENAAGAPHPRAKDQKHVPACTFSIPVDATRQPVHEDQVDLLAPTGVPMLQQYNRRGVFLAEGRPAPPPLDPDVWVEPGPEPTQPLVLKVDREGKIRFASPFPFRVNVFCEICGARLRLHESPRGLSLRCRRTWKCPRRKEFQDLPELQRKNIVERYSEYLSPYERLSLTRQDGETPVLDGTPLSSLIIPGGPAQLPKFEEE